MKYTKKVELLVRNIFTSILFQLYRCKCHYILVLTKVGVLLLFVSCQPNNSMQPNVLPTNSAENKVDLSYLNKQIEREMPSFLDDLDKFASNMSIQGLREKKLKVGEVEVRIWVGSSPHEIKGLILENNKTFQKVRYLPPVGEKTPVKVNPLQALTPYSGKEKFWGVIETSGLLKFHNKTVIVENEPLPDAESIILEVKKGDEYDSYFYSAVCYSDTHEAKDFISLLTFFNKELNINFFNCN